MNEPLRRALQRARLREGDVAAQLGVDPKTVRRWLYGRIPYAKNRADLADLVGVAEDELWPMGGSRPTARFRPDELEAVYPHRWMVPRETWIHLFESAEYEIGILAYSALFLVEDAGILDVLADRAEHGVLVQIALGHPDSTTVGQRGADEGIGDAMAARIRNAIYLLRPLLRVQNVEMRLHSTVLYNSIYRADDQAFINQHAYGVPASRTAVLRLRRSSSSRMISEYIASFEKIWDKSAVIM